MLSCQSASTKVRIRSEGKACCRSPSLLQKSAISCLCLLERNCQPYAKENEHFRALSQIKQLSILDHSLVSGWGEKQRLQGRFFKYEELEKCQPSLLTTTSTDRKKAWLKWRWQEMVSRGNFRLAEGPVWGDAIYRIQSDLMSAQQK